MNRVIYWLIVLVITVPITSFAVDYMKGKSQNEISLVGTGCFLICMFIGYSIERTLRDRNKITKNKDGK